MLIIQNRNFLRQSSEIHSQFLKSKTERISFQLLTKLPNRTPQVSIFRDVLLFAYCINLSGSSRGDTTVRKPYLFELVVLKRRYIYQRE